MVSKAKTLFFPSKESRDARYHDQLRARKSGMVIQTASRNELDQWRAFQAASNGTPWQDVVAGWREHQIATKRVVTALSVDEAVDQYLARMRTLRDQTDATGQPTPKLGADTYRQKDHKLTLFKEQFGDFQLSAVPAEEIEAWIEDFPQVATDVTFDNYVKHVSALYGYFIDKRLITDNPTREVKRRGDGVGKIGIITPEECARLFETALTYQRGGEKIFLPVIGRLALEAFVGLRFSSGCRIERRDINFEDRGIRLPRHKLKTGMVSGGRSHYIDNLPAQVWEWLAITPAECWVVRPRDYMRLKSLLFTTAKVPHPHNCFRHSFATYDMAAHKNPGRTATILCHTNQELLWKHYYGVATHSAGVKYQQITPQTAKQLAEGFSSVPIPSIG